MPSNLDATAWTLLVMVIVLAVSFDFINGFHDTANAIATVVATRVLTAGAAIMMAAVLNFVGALTGQAVAKTVTSGLVDAKAVQGLGFQLGQVLIMAALIGAIAWNLITWYYGIPSSSSHALIGGIVGASIAALGTGRVIWEGLLNKVVLPLIFSPVIGFVASRAVDESSSSGSSPKLRLSEWGMSSGAYNWCRPRSWPSATAQMMLKRRWA